MDFDKIFKSDTGNPADTITRDEMLKIKPTIVGQRDLVLIEKIERLFELIESDSENHAAILLARRSVISHIRSSLEAQES